MRAGALACLGVFILGSVLALLQLWFELMSAEFFGKIMLTLGVLFVVVLGTTLVLREYVEGQKLKDSGHVG